jgi:hypothetical protein
MKLRLALAVLTTAVPGFIATSSAVAQQQSGLVNVAVVDNIVQIPIGIAANVCDVSVNVLAQATSTNPVTCTAVAGATATSTGNTGSGTGVQQGLVNIYVANNTIQVPVGIAANICGVAANVLAQNVSTGTASCDALGNATATG